MQPEVLCVMLYYHHATRYKSDLQASPFFHGNILCCFQQDQSTHTALHIIVFLFQICTMGSIVQTHSAYYANWNPTTFCAISHSGDAKVSEDNIFKSSDFKVHWTASCSTAVRFGDWTYKTIKLYCLLVQMTESEMDQTELWYHRPHLQYNNWVFYSKHNVLEGGLPSSESTAVVPVSGPLNMSIQMAKTSYHDLSYEMQGSRYCSQSSYSHLEYLKN